MEEYFAEMQLFSPWRSKKLQEWRDPETCIMEFHDRQTMINKVRSKTFPFSMNALIEEMKSYEAARNDGKIYLNFVYRNYWNRGRPCIILDSKFPRLVS